MNFQMRGGNIFRPEFSMSFELIKLFYLNNVYRENILLGHELGFLVSYLSMLFTTLPKVRDIQVITSITLILHLALIMWCISRKEVFSLIV